MERIDVIHVILVLKKITNFLTLNLILHYGMLYNIDRLLIILNIVVAEISDFNVKYINFYIVPFFYIKNIK